MSARFPFFHLDKKGSRIAFGIVSIVVVVLIIVLIAAVGVGISHIGKTTMPQSSYGFMGDNYGDVVKQLEAAGFTNIETEVAEYTMNGESVIEGAVVQVSVDGVTSFDTETYFKRKAEIFVSYQTVPENMLALPNSSSGFHVPPHSSPASWPSLPKASHNSALSFAIFQGMVPLPSMTGAMSAAIPIK